MRGIVGIAAIDLFVVPTLTFERLFAFLVLGHDRRQLLWFEVTRHPTAEWLARQITEAFPWASAPAYLVRDNGRAYGHVFMSRVRAMGIRDRPICFEGTLTDAVSKLIIENSIIPRLRANDFAGGIGRGVDDIIQAVSVDSEE